MGRIFASGSINGVREGDAELARLGVPEAVRTCMFLGTDRQRERLVDVLTKAVTAAALHPHLDKTSPEFRARIAEYERFTNRSGNLAISAGVTGVVAGAAAAYEAAGAYASGWNSQLHTRGAFNRLMEHIVTAGDHVSFQPVTGAVVTAVGVVATSGVLGLMHDAEKDAEEVAPDGYAPWNNALIRMSRSLKRFEKALGDTPFDHAEMVYFLTNADPGVLGAVADLAAPTLGPPGSALGR